VASLALPWFAPPEILSLKVATFKGGRSVVADRTKKGHRTWLETPGKKGQKHRDTPMRNFLDPEDEFLERWDLLGLG
jgi:hypothetical protein